MKRYYGRKRNRYPIFVPAGSSWAMADPELWLLYMARNSNLNLPKLNNHKPRNVALILTLKGSVCQYIHRCTCSTGKHPVMHCTWKQSSPITAFQDPTSSFRPISLPPSSQYYRIPSTTPPQNYLDSRTQTLNYRGNAQKHKGTRKNTN